MASAPSAQESDTRKATGEDRLTWRALFAKDVIDKLGIKDRPEAYKALIAWMQLEGGHFDNNAKFNPLNTTLPKPGAGNTGSQGNIKVYTSYDQGVEATVETLKMSAYRLIVGMFQFGSVDDIADAIDASPWCPNCHEAPAIKRIASGIDLSEVKDNNGKTIDDYGNAVTNAGGDVLSAAGDVINSIPKLIEKITQGSFWLDVGKILFGLIAIVLGVRYFVKDYGLS